MEINIQSKGYLLENFKIFHIMGSQGIHVDYHYHEFYKLLLLNSGSGRYYLEGTTYSLMSGDIVLVASHYIHKPQFEPGVPYERTILYISPQYISSRSTEGCSLDALFTGNPVLRTGKEAQKKIFGLAAQLESEISGDKYGHEVLSDAILMALLVAIGREQQLQSSPSEIPAFSPKVQEILCYLNQHFSEDISIDDLSGKMYLSKYHMMRRFHSETGRTIHQYLIEQRLICAKRLIANGCSATEACYSSGWHSYSSFCRAYYKGFGDTPMGRIHGPREETIE